MSIYLEKPWPLPEEQKLLDDMPQGGRWEVRHIDSWLMLLIFSPDGLPIVAIKLDRDQALAMAKTLYDGLHLLKGK